MEKRMPVSDKGKGRGIGLLNVKQSIVEVVICDDDKEDLDKATLMLDKDSFRISGSVSDTVVSVSE